MIESGYCNFSHYRSRKGDQHQEWKEKYSNDFIGHKYHKQISVHRPVDIENPSCYFEYHKFQQVQDGQQGRTI